MDGLTEQLLVLDLDEVGHVQKLTTSFTTSANVKFLSAAADFPSKKIIKKIF